jgi:Right handed beta helix region
MHRKATTLLSLTIAALALALPSAASADMDCDLVAAPGSSANEAVDALADGQTLCFRAGVYSFDELNVRAADVTVRSYPGERATLRGQFRVERSASGAVVEDLLLEGPRADIFSPLIYADRTVLRNNEITNHHSSNCVHLATYYDAPAPRDVLIEGNRIHDCGRLPATNHDHGIYIAASRNAVIRDNLIYDNADRGIQLFPDAQGTRIEGNVIDGNGQGILFSGYEGVSSHDTTVVHNVITNSKLRHNVESFYPEDTPPGRNNVVRENCIHGAEGWYKEEDGSGIAYSHPGFEATNNVIADPKYSGRPSGDFALAPGSACAGVLEGVTDQQLSLEAVKPTVRPGERTTLRGEVPVTLTSQVWIFKKSHGNWKSFKRASLKGANFSAKVRVHRRSHFKARAAGVRDSNAVAVTARGKARR